jgi:glutamate formiminotransferase/formiminotetrahydrofolate cyclodeaminase
MRRARARPSAASASPAASWWAWCRSSRLLDAADFYLKRQERSLGISEREKIKIAVKSLGLDDLAPFDPAEKVIEYLLENPEDERLVRMDLKRFSEETAAESPAPGGGSVAAYVGALGAALGHHGGQPQRHKRGWDDRWERIQRMGRERRRYCAMSCSSSWTRTRAPSTAS